MMVMIDGPMISRFIEDAGAFAKFADEQFNKIDQNDIVKYKFAKSEELDDREVFRAELMKMMAAVAQGIGRTPVKVLVVEEGSLLVKAYEVEIARLRKEAEAAEKEAVAAEKAADAAEEAAEERRRSVANGGVEVLGQRKMMKKKKSMKLLSNFCVCSGNYDENTSQ